MALIFLEHEIQVICYECVLFRDMRTIRRKTKKKKCYPSFASKTLDKILKTALDPEHIKDSLATIHQVTAEIAGKFLQLLQLRLFCCNC